MKSPFSFFTVVLSLFTLLSCTSSAPKNEAATDPALAHSMQGLKGEMDLFLPYLVNPAKFHAVENQEKVRTQIANLEATSTHVTHTGSMQSQDPALEFLSKGFQQEIHRAREAFDGGHTEYARGSLLNVTAFCIECHTRTRSGPSFQNTTTDQELKSLRPLNRGEYLLATRQFPAALKEFTAVIQGGTTQGNNIADLDRAVQLALQITVRYQGDPKATLNVTKDIQSAPSLPYYMKQTAKVWQASAESWKKESKRKNKDRLKLAQSLVHDARALQNGREDQTGDIQMMRVQAFLHPVVAQEKDTARLGQALFLLGVAYESVKDEAMWTLHEDYYRTCIEKDPHSEWSSKCYRNLEASILQGYTGSGGTRVPEEVSKDLEKMKVLAL